MKCNECGSNKELYIYKDKVDCEVLCKECLINTSRIEEDVVVRYIDLMSNEVFYDKESLAEYVINRGYVNVISQEVFAYHDIDTDEYIDHDDDDELFNYIEEKYNAEIVDASECPCCGGMEKTLYLVTYEECREIMCLECFLEKYSIKIYHQKNSKLYNISIPFGNLTIDIDLETEENEVEKDIVGILNMIDNLSIEEIC